MNCRVAKSKKKIANINHQPSKLLPRSLQNGKGGKSREREREEKITRGKRNENK